MRIVVVLEASKWTAIFLLVGGSCVVSAVQSRTAIIVRLFSYTLLSLFRRALRSGLFAIDPLLFGILPY
jgi:hypothetical protein